MIRASQFLRKSLNSSKNTQIARAYNERVVEYFENPPNVGSLKRKRQDVGTGKTLLYPQTEVANFYRCGWIYCLWRPVEVPGQRWWRRSDPRGRFQGKFCHFLENSENWKSWNTNFLGFRVWISYCQFCLCYWIDQGKDCWWSWEDFQRTWAFFLARLFSLNMDDFWLILDISSYLKLPPVKRHCSLLAEEAIAAALEDFKQKNNSEGQN